MKTLTDHSLHYPPAPRARHSCRLRVVELCALAAYVAWPVLILSSLQPWIA